MALPFLDSLHSQPGWFIILFSLGLLTITKLTLSLLYYSYAYFLRPAKDLKSCYGPWAVVTGPTDGIGKFMAIELARKGLHLVLVGRNPAKLSDVSTTIHAELPNTMIKNVVIDLSADLDEGVRRLKEATDGVDVGVLVNNAGVASARPTYFDEGDVGMWMETVRVNAEAVTAVARAVLPGMVERGRGAVVNVGSGSTVAIPSFPLYAVYAGTKGYVDQFSKCLHVEYKSKGIDVQNQVPLFVATKMISKMKMGKLASLFVPTAATYARAAVNWIGYEKQSIPYFPHFLQWCLAKLVPEFIHDHLRLSSNLKQRERIMLRSKRQG